MPPRCIPSLKRSAGPLGAVVRNAPFCGGHKSAVTRFNSVRYGSGPDMGQAWVGHRVIMEQGLGMG